MPDTPMSPAERVAALTALRAGLDDQLDKAKADAIAEASTQRRASWSTPYGPVNMTRSDEKPEIIPERFLAFCLEEYPDEVIQIPAVRSSFVEAFTRELVIVAGKVVHKPTGLVVDFARVKPEGAPSISYPASSQQRDAKEYARLLFEERAALLETALREVAAS